MPVILEPIKHIYYDDETGEQYLPISKLIGLYKPKFDPTGEVLIGSARKQSKLRGVEITPQMLKAEWLRKGTDANTRGTFVHECLENYIKNKVVPPIDSPEYIAVGKFAKFEFDGTLVSEQVFSNHDYMVAGTSDLPCYDHKNMTGLIYDFKTDKELNFTSKYNNYFSDPVSHLEACEWTEHALQLSFYSYFMELKGYKIKNPWVFHIVVDKKFLEVTKDNQQGLFERDGILYNIGEEIVESWRVKDVKKIPCPYLKLEVLLILNDYKSRYLKKK